MSAADVMTSEVICCQAGTSDEQAEGLMEKHQLRRLVVTDADNNLVGVLAQADIARRQGGADAGKLVRAISQKSN